MTDLQQAILTTMLERDRQTGRRRQDYAAQDLVECGVTGSAAGVGSVLRGFVTTGITELRRAPSAKHKQPAKYRLTGRGKRAATTLLKEKAQCA